MRTDIPDINARIVMLRQEIGEVEFETWFEGATTLNVPPMSITLRTGFRASQVRSKYLPILQRLFGQEVLIHHAPLLAPPPTASGGHPSE
jgi:hypothetical protein